MQANKCTNSLSGKAAVKLVEPTLQALRLKNHLNDPVAIECGFLD
jgi:hypothetical protein